MNILHERIDDIPLIISYLIKKNVNTLIDLTLLNHGNQNTLSNGDVAIIWLAYVLSEGDHRKVHVRDWVQSRLSTLSACIGKQVDVNNFTDDRLSRLLFRFCSDEKWSTLENGIAKETLSLIPVEMMLETCFEKAASNAIRGVFKLDATSISGSHEVNQEGLMQFGFSKNHRPDLPQTKVMYCSEGVSGCPLITEIDQGNINDDCMYEPVLKRMRGTFDTNNFLYCGDSKMSIRKIREGMVENNEFYLCPLQLSNIQVRKTFNEEWVTDAINGTKQIIQIYDGEEHLAYGYELTRHQQNLENTLEWNERVLLVKSLGYFEGEKKKFNHELTKMRDTISKITSKICKTSEEAALHLQNNLEKCLNKSSLNKEMFIVETKIEEISKTYERTEVRNSGKRKGSYELKSYRGIVKSVLLNKVLIETYLERIGWRAFVTNVPSEFLNFSGAYRYYRKTQYVIEEGFHMLKAKPIGISPLYVKREDQIKGLLRFMTLGVLFLKLLSLEISISLKECQETLVGLTVGQPKKKTIKPTTVSILSYFYRSNITLSWVEFNGEWKSSVTKLPDLCSKILNLLGIEDKIYSGLAKFKLEEMRAK